MFKKICLVGILMLSVSTLSWADKIYLKNGTVVEGKIYEASAARVKIETEGTHKTYYMHRIDRIERENYAPWKDEATEEYFRDMEIPGADAPISEEKKELIIRLLDANGARKSMMLVFNQIISQAPEDTREELRGILKTDEIVLYLVPVYSTYYFEEELKQLVAFYRSETGQKHVGLTQQLMEETMMKAAEYFENKVAARDEDVQDEREKFERARKARLKALAEQKAREGEVLQKEQ